eukprot:6389681-Lingulodinium_polyedra.AAC.1
MDSTSALAGAVVLLAPVVANRRLAFDCATAVSAALLLGAQCCEQLRLPLLEARLRQLATIFASFGYQMKGEHYLDRSPWPIRWMDSMGGHPAVRADLQGAGGAAGALARRDAARGPLRAQPAAGAQRVAAPAHGHRVRLRLRPGPGAAGEALGDQPGA